jgi:hypothetical protein
VNGEQPPAKIDTTVPHSARIWNYWLGGKDNYEVAQRTTPECRVVYVDNGPIMDTFPIPTWPARPSATCWVRSPRAAPGR